MSRAIYSGAELILQPFRHFIYVTTHSPNLPSLYLRRSSFPNPSVASPTSQLILKPFFCFSYVTGSSLNVTWLAAHAMQSSFSNLSIASPMSQLILQPFHRFTYVTAHSPILPLLHLHHSSFSNPSFASPTSQALHLTSPGEPPMPNTPIISTTFFNKYLSSASFMNLSASCFENILECFGL